MLTSDTCSDGGMVCQAVPCGQGRTASEAPCKVAWPPYIWQGLAGAGPVKLAGGAGATPPKSAALSHPACGQASTAYGSPQKPACYIPIVHVLKGDLEEFIAGSCHHEDGLHFKTASRWLSLQKAIDTAMSFVTCRTTCAVRQS